MDTIHLNQMPGQVGNQHWDGTVFSPLDSLRTADPKSDPALAPLLDAAFQRPDRESRLVHELAHQKHADHDEAFYRLCCHMESDYHQLEFDLRIWLSALDARRETPPDTPAP
mgnify:CR=1 FL=1